MIFTCNIKAFVKQASLHQTFKLKLFSYINGPVKVSVSVYVVSPLWQARDLVGKENQNKPLWQLQEFFPITNKNDDV